MAENGNNRPRPRTGSLVDAIVNKYAVNRRGQWEVIRNSLYHFQSYALAGQSSLTFFQDPNGSGGRTFADTNMEAAGVLPSPQRFLILGMEVYFSSAEFPSEAPKAPDVDNQVNDVFEVVTGSAWLELTIGSKPYLREAPLLRMPPSAFMTGFAGLSDSTTAGASGFSRTSYASAAGEPYRIDPPLMLEATQNFKVTLNFPTSIGISAATRIGVVMPGLLMRQSQ